MGDLALRDLPDLNLTSVPSWDRLNSKLERKVPHLTPSLTCRLRSDQLDLEALQVSEDPPDPKGSWDLRETPETPEAPDLLDSRASQDCPD
jgi:hypothetical protein